MRSVDDGNRTGGGDSGDYGRGGDKKTGESKNRERREDLDDHQSSYDDGFNGYEDYDEYLEYGYDEDPEKDYPDEHDLEYLRQLEDSEDEYEKEPPGKTPLLRVVALLTALAFLGLVVAVSWPVAELPLAKLVSRSLQLEKDIDVKKLQAAVVDIEVVARRPGSPLVERKSGTGFNIKPEGLVVTNHHVIENALNMTITFPDGKICRAVRWLFNPDYDLAVVELSAESLPVVPVNYDRMPGPGERVRVVGNPLGLNNIVVEGEIHGYVRLRGREETVLSIDAPIYPGNSGSPVFNQKGEVIGVVFARYQSDSGGENKIFGLAVPIQEILNMRDENEKRA